VLQRGSYALGNHEHAPDASHPLYLEDSNVVDVATDGMFFLSGPDPEWRNEAGEEPVKTQANLQER